MPSGSYLVISRATRESDPKTGSRGAEVYKRATSTLTFRDREQVRRLFDGFDLVEPGIVAAHEWRPEARKPADPAGAWVLCGVGRKS